MITAENFKIKYSEMDYRLALKPSSLLNFLQDIASDNAEKLGFGYSFVSKNNLGWFLLKYRMEFSEYPVNVEKLLIKTQPRGCNKLFAYRDFIVFDDNKVLGKIFSCWSLVNLNTKTSVLPQNYIKSEYMQAYKKLEDDLNFKKIKPLIKIDIEKEFEIRFDDLDVNSHVNNCNYIIWALETLDFKFRSLHKIKTVDIYFKKEVKFGSRIVSQVEFLSDDVTSHVIINKDTNEDLCQIEIVWDKF